MQLRLIFKVPAGQQTGPETGQDVTYYKTVVIPCPPEIENDICISSAVIVGAEMLDDDPPSND